MYVCMYIYIYIYIYIHISLGGVAALPRRPLSVPTPSGSRRYICIPFGPDGVWAGLYNNE